MFPSKRPSQQNAIRDEGFLTLKQTILLRNRRRIAWIVKILAVAVGYLIWWPLHRKWSDGTPGIELWLAALTLLLSIPPGVLVASAAAWLEAENGDDK